MENFKIYVFSVIITSIILQIGSVFLKETGFYAFYRGVTGFVMIAVMFSPLFSVPDFSLKSIVLNDSVDYSDHNIKNVFAEKLENKIKSDIIQAGFGSCNISVETNWSSLNITITTGQDADSRAEMKKYVKSKYCTSDDEVNVIGYE